MESTLASKFFEELDYKTQLAVLQGFAYCVISEDIESLEIFFDFNNLELAKLQGSIDELMKTIAKQNQETKV